MLKFNIFFRQRVASRLELAALGLREKRLYLLSHGCALILINPGRIYKGVNVCCCVGVPEPGHRHTARGPAEIGNPQPGTGTAHKPDWGSGFIFPPGSGSRRGKFEEKTEKMQGNW